MTCHDARELFSALVDDALGASERDALDRHLATCADCGRELQRFRDTVALLRSVEPARAPAGFVDRVLDAARPAPWPRRLLRALFLPWPLKLPVEAAAVVLVAVGVVYVFRATPELQRASRLESPPAPSREMYHEAPEKGQAPEQQRLQKKSAAAPPAARDEAKPRAAGEASRDLGRQKAESRPSTPAEPRVAEKLAAPPARAERELGAAQESSRLPAAPAPESRPDVLQGARAATEPPPVSSVTPPDVAGQLSVTDRNAALRSIGQLAARLGAVEDRRIDGDEVSIIELTISREAYAEFVRELARLGRWRPTREAAALPAQVRVVLRIIG